MKIFFVQFSCVFLPPLLKLFILPPFQRSSTSHQSPGRPLHRQHFHVLPSGSHLNPQIFVLLLKMLSTFCLVLPLCMCLPVTSSYLLILEDDLFHLPPSHPQTPNEHLFCTRSWAEFGEKCNPPIMCVHAKSLQSCLPLCNPGW